jgi:regulator of sigma E protease
MSVLTTPLAFIFVLGVIIFFHEFGHFATAKAFGMKVFIFSFGFGKRLFGFKWGGTDCRVSLIPLGGYVKLEGEPDDFLSERQDVAALNDGEIVRVDSPDYFTNRPRWQRILVYVAGPVMNGVLTIGIFTGLYMHGWRVDATFYDRPIIGAVEPNSPAAGAGLKPGDEIVAIDGQPQENWEDAQINVVLRPDRDVTLRVRHGSEERSVTLHTQARGKERVGWIGVAPMVRIGDIVPGEPAEAAGLKADDGILRIDGRAVASFDDIVSALKAAADKPLRVEIYRDGGVQPVMVTPRSGKIGIASKALMKKFGPAGAVAEAIRATARLTRQTFDMLSQIVTARVSPKAGLTGPLGIAKISGEAARTSWAALFYVIAAISLSVGILNLFPLAPLDGGHLAILVGESLVRRDFSLNVKNWIMNAGALVLFLLIGFVLYADVTKLDFSWLKK